MDFSIVFQSEVTSSLQYSTIKLTSDNFLFYLFVISYHKVKLIIITVSTELFDWQQY